MDPNPAVSLKVYDTPLVWRILRHCMWRENEGQNTSTLKHDIFTNQITNLGDKCHRSAAFRMPQSVSNTRVRHETVIFTLQIFTPSFTFALSDKFITCNTKTEHWL